MDEINVETELIFLIYDIISPDRWRSSYRIQTLNAGKEELDALYKEENFILMLKEPEDSVRLTRYNALLPKITKIYDKILENLTESVIRLFVDGTEILDITERKYLFGNIKNYLKIEPPENTSAKINHPQELTWVIACPCLFSGDIMKNPRHDPRHITKTKMNIAIMDAWGSARRALSEKLHTFQFLNASSYLLNPDQARAPNVNNPLRFDKSKPRIVFEYEFDESGNTLRERNIFRNGLRDPRDGDTFEEFLTSELLPVFQHTKEYFAKNKARFYRFQYRFTSLDKLVKLIRFQLPDKEAITDVLDIIQDSYWEHGTLNEIDEKLKVVLTNLEQGNIRSMRNLQDAYEIQLEKYVQFINNWPFAQANPKDLLEQIRIRIEKNYIEANLNCPSNKLLLDSAIKENWFYTIPTYLINPNYKGKERDECIKIRLSIEAQLTYLKSVIG
jgi:hypothetical protein